MNKRGLTLIELLAVISIIAILFVLLIPQISSGIYKAKVSGVQTDFRDYQVPLEGYIMEKGFPKDKKFIDEIFKGQLGFKNGESVSKSPFDTKYYLTYNKDLIELYTIDDTKDKKIYSLVYKKTEDGGKSEFLGFEEEIKYEDKYPYTLKEEDVDLVMNADGTYDITLYKSGERDIVIKSEINGKRIKSISGSAFSVVGLDKIVIEEGIEVLKEGAFSVTGFKEIHIPSTVKTIGYNAFTGNAEGKYFVSASNQYFKNGENGAGIYSKDGKTLLSGGMDIFDTNAIKTVEHINHTALYAKDLEEIKIPASLKTIGNSVFSDNPKIRFIVDSANTNFKAGSNGIGLYSKDGKTLYVGMKEIFNQPEYNAVTFVYNSAFYNARLTEAKLPTSLNKLGTASFRGNNIEEILLPSTLTTIASDAFGDNNKMKKVINKTTLDVSSFFKQGVVITRE